MIDAGSLQRRLCSAFNAAIEVSAVPAGYAVGTPFADSSGDRIGFYVVAGPDGCRVEDDGAYLSHLVASGIDIEHG